MGSSWCIRPHARDEDEDDIANRRHRNTNAPSDNNNCAFAPLQRAIAFAVAFDNPLVTSRAIDCAAGVGRVTSGLLMHRYDVVDVLEPLPHFIAEARRRLSSKPHKGQFFAIGLQVPVATLCFLAGLLQTDSAQEFRPPPNTYDVVWVQWAIGHVTDEDLVPLLLRLKACLTPSGVIVLKENVLTGNGGSSAVLDLEGCSVRRSAALFKALFGRAGCRVVREDVQKQHPSDLCRVKMWALR
jgi:protein N-terminal methyltransferase